MANFLSDTLLETAMVYFELYAPESVTKAAWAATEFLKGWVYGHEDDSDIVINPDKPRVWENYYNASPICHYQDRNRNGEKLVSPDYLWEGIKQRRNTDPNQPSQRTNTARRYHSY